MEMAYCSGVFRFLFRNTQIITVEMGKKMNGLQRNPFNKLWLKMFNHSIFSILSVLFEEEEEELFIV